MADNTIVVLLGDHGWNLGEHNFIGKHNLMDTSTHVPLIIRVPGKKQGKCWAMVEFVDLYPTLCRLCGLPEPEQQLSGKSFAQIFSHLNAKTKDHVYIQWEGGDNAVDRRYNYAEWPPPTGDVKAQMLFDHKHDPLENRNVAREKQNSTAVKKSRAFLKGKKRVCRF